MQIISSALAPITIEADRHLRDASDSFVNNLVYQIQAQREWTLEIQSRGVDGLFEVLSTQIGLSRRETGKRSLWT